MRAQEALRSDENEADPLRAVARDEGLDAPRPPRILLLEDDPAMRDLLQAVLEDAGYRVQCGRSTAPLVDRIAAGARREDDPNFDLVVSDIRMPGRTGLEVLEGIRRHDFLQPVILITAFGSREVHAEAARLGASILDKPFEMAQLVELARELCPPDPTHPNVTTLAA